MSINCSLFMSPDSSKTHSSTGLLANIADILVIDRLRPDDDTERSYIETELVPSIADQGLIVPIILNKLDQPTTGPNIYGDTITSDLRLIEGWSRLVAFTYLKLTEIPYAERASLSNGELHMLEIESNIRRRNMPWQSKVLGIYKVHKEKTSRAKEARERWGQRATGELLNIDVASVNESLKMANFILANDEEVMACQNFDSAKKVLFRREQKRVEEILAQRTVAEVSVVKTQVPYSRDIISLTGVPNSALEIQIESTVSIPLSNCCFNKPSVTSFGDGALCDVPDASVDLIFTDIPYGVDTADMLLADVSLIEGEHKVDENMALFEPFLQESFRVLKPDTFCLFFYDISHHNLLLDLAKKVGFFSQAWPLMWHKLSQVQNRAANCQWPKDFEYMMVLRKGRPTLRDAQPTSVIAASSAQERKHYGHPFAKPVSFCQKVLAPILAPGMVVCDPFVGSGSMICAAIELGAKPLVFEKITEHYNRLLENLKDTYRRIHPNREITFL